MSERDARIIEMAVAGYAFAEIGRQFGLTGPYVGRIARPVVGKRPFRNVVYAAKDRQRAVDLVTLGATYAEAAEATGMTRSAVAGAVWRARMGKP